MSEQIVLALVTVVVAAVVGYFLYTARGSTKATLTEVEKNGSGPVKAKKATVAPPSKKKDKGKENQKATTDEQKPTHQWLAGTLKGHTGGVNCLDFSLNGKFMASVAEDRTALIWMTKDFLQHDHKQIRVNLGLDSASKIFWSPDSKAFVVAKPGNSSIAVYKLGKKPDGSIGNVTQVYELENIHGGNEIITVAIASSGKFMLSASCNGQLKIMDVKGNTLHEMMSGIKPLTCVKLSSCGRFIVTCGASNHIEVFGVKYAKDGSFQGLTFAYSLLGHDGDVVSIDINTDASNIVSVDTKGTWRLFDATGTKPTQRFSNKVNGETSAALIVAISNDSRISAVGADNEIHLFSAKTGKFLKKLETYYDEPLTDVKFSMDDLYIVLSANDDRCIKIYHNVCGYMEKMKDLKEQSKTAESATMKDRFKQEAEAVASAVKDLKIRLD